MSWPSCDDDGSVCCYCCWWCLQRCCGPNHKAEKYPHVKYEAPHYTSAVMEAPEMRQVPLEKIFHFPQHQRQFPVHPQMPLKEGVVTTQPKSGSAQRQKESAPSRTGRPRETRSVSPRCDTGHIHERHRPASVSPPRSPSYIKCPGSMPPRSASLQVSHSERPLLASSRSTSISLDRSRSPSPELPAARKTLRSVKKWLTISRSPSPEPVAKHKLASTSTVSKHDGSSDQSGESEVGVISPTTGSFPEKVPSIYKSASFNFERFQSISSEDSEVTGLGQLEFSVYLDVLNRRLSVKLLQAMNLPQREGGRLRDPFVVVFLLPNKETVFQTAVVKQTLNPRFDAAFEFQGIQQNEIRQQELVFQVCDGSKNNLIGSVVLPLKGSVLFGVCLWRYIKPEDSSVRTKGDLLLSLQFSPRVQILQGIVLKVTNLQHSHFYKLADPYVKLELYYKQKRIHKWKTSVKKNTLIPVFNEPFRFDLSRMDIKDVTLETTIMDHDRFGRNRTIGMVTLGSTVSNETGKAHWLEMLSSPRQQVSHWHPIIDPAEKQIRDRTRTL